MEKRRCVHLLPPASEIGEKMQGGSDVAKKMIKRKLYKVHTVLLVADILPVVDSSMTG